MQQVQKQVFFIEVVGNIDVGVAFSMQVAAQAQLSKGTIDFDGALKMRVEASLALGGGLVGFLFIGGSLSSDSSTKYVASVETGFTGGLKIGADNAGLYIDTIIKFAGLSATAQKEQKNVEGGGERTKTLGPYLIAKEITLLKNEISRLYKVTDSLQKQYQLKLNVLQGNLDMGLNNNIHYTNEILHNIILCNILFLIIIVFTFFKGKI
ncbi:hypothetical protein [Tenacibaculum finnmarkense]|uniref:hypothetical protein n=1 Tax=Tenacibaculum finnmarkense TaxID=2781243 RepID=UPI000C38546A|nr:hypothetical protein [Tenacibaculum finnmarkense]MCD8440839.1 hypothetical protein [Tenacibaculum finnmarkense genomovar ulcerans]MCG8721749.1 hypothetical protein [Tenacibaculum finnmarkense]SOS55905.1 membrane hypothetical protein [Tenacibaculum finnmarkense]